MSINENKARQVDLTRLPRHIAIIMDGNGRWAQQKGLPRTAGHKVGAETFRKIATYCREIGIEYLTVYAFSTENWKRPKDEVATIMELLTKYVREAIETMQRDQIRLSFLGDLNPLSNELKGLIEEANTISNNNHGFQANICINYGGQKEIISAIKQLYEDIDRRKININDLDENLFSQYLYTSKLPNPELIIRTSGEIRTSNFLLWQSAYSEYYFTDVLWPDFDREELDKAIIDFQNRKRRYGNIK